MHARTPKRTFSEAEYLAMERASDRKHEYYQGEIFAMAGGSLRHNEITGRLIAALTNALEGRRGRVFSPDQRVKIPDSRLYTYPDVSVSCGPRIDEKNDTLQNPQLIAEVLSDGTEAYDRGEKFAHYQTISSLAEYLLVSQTEPKIEQHTRQADGSWRLTVLRAGRALRLDSLQCEISVDYVFRGVFDAD
jgi:Uma2 family endonuclease